MSFSEHPSIKEILPRLKEGMIDFIVPGDTGYTEKEVDTCLQMLAVYLQAMEASSSKEEGMKIVEQTVLALNDLNEKCEHELIETEQREDIAEIIILAGSLKGYNDVDDDITEDWRDW
ncbi:MAG: hypothetical protein AAF696_28500 [Bacteroidota bacterium]